jgi:hypothetical protein
MTESPRRKRGRPRVVDWSEIVGDIYDPAIPPGAWLRSAQGGRPADHAHDQWLLEIVNNAQRRGKRMLRTCLKEALEHKLGRAPEPEEVSSCERQIGRLRSKSHKRPRLF